MDDSEGGHVSVSKIAPVAAEGVETGVRITIKVRCDTMPGLIANCCEFPDSESELHSAAT